MIQNIYIKSADTAIECVCFLFVMDKYKKNTNKKWIAP